MSSLSLGDAYKVDDYAWKTTTPAPGDDPSVSDADPSDFVNLAL
jgi:hypothetical protein